MGVDQMLVGFARSDDAPGDLPTAPQGDGSAGKPGRQAIQGGNGIRHPCSRPQVPVDGLIVVHQIDGERLAALHRCHSCLP